VIPLILRVTTLEAAMMGRRDGQWSLFYQFWVDERVPKDHLLRRIDRFVTVALADLHARLEPYYSEIGRPSVDPELMIRMLIVGYCYGLRSERRLMQEVELHLAYRWFSRLDLDDKVPHHSTFSENRLHRFRESDVFRHIFERVVTTCMTAGLVKGEGFAVDASVMEANASRYHGKAPDEIVWVEPERRSLPVALVCGRLSLRKSRRRWPSPPRTLSFAKVAARESAVIAVAGVANRDMGRDLAANQPTEEATCAISRISGEPLRLQAETPLGSSEHGFCSFNLVV
jgi:transposase